ncbi:MAG: hypothetical protein JRF61_27630 [Deltaproteobacteria bacterium]|nr:hypothetical protein [Deltaproteobacteria bacterium]
MPDAIQTLPDPRGWTHTQHALISATELVDAHSTTNQDLIYGIGGRFDPNVFECRNSDPVGDVHCAPGFSDLESTLIATDESRMFPLAPLAVPTTDSWITNLLPGAFVAAGIGCIQGAPTA